MSNPATDNANRSPLGQFLTEGYFKANPPELQCMSVAVYRMLSEGTTPNFNEIGRALNMDREQVTGLFSNIPKSAYEFGDDEKLVGFIGLSVTPAPHTFIVGERTLYTWCAFDALFLPEIIGKTAFLKTTCPSTEKPIELLIDANGVQKADPRSCVLSIVSPDIKACCDDLRGAFCNQVNLFINESAFHSWPEKRADSFCVDLTKASQFARQRNEARFPDVKFN